MIPCTYILYTLPPPPPPRLGIYIGTQLLEEGGVTLAIYILKYLKAKKRIMETKIFHHAKIKSSKKNPPKETKILQDIITLL
jgi:hypothetical protein